MSEYAIIVCACGQVSGMSAREIVIADFLRVEIEEGWREIRERELLDPPAPADLPVAPPGAEQFEFRGVCADCAARVEAFRAGGKA